MKILFYAVFCIVEFTTIYANSTTLKINESQVIKLIEDDEGLKIIAHGSNDSIIFSNKKPLVFFLKNTHPQFNQYANILKNSKEQKVLISISTQNKMIESVTETKKAK